MPIQILVKFDYFFTRIIQYLIMEIKELDQLKELDPKIKNLVYALNRCGIKTNSSCEGHVIEGQTPYPYVTFDLGAEEETFNHNQAQQNYMKIQNNPSLRKHKDIAFKEVVDAYIKKDTALAHGMKNAQKLLEEYYEQYHPAYHLTLFTYQDNMITFSSAKQQQYMRSKEEQQKNLSIMQNEMQKFADFLNSTDGKPVPHCYSQSSKS